MNTKQIIGIVIVLIAIIATVVFISTNRQQSQQPAATSSGQAAPPQTSTSQTSASGKAIYIIYDIGGRGDLSFNDMAYLGASEAARDFGLQLVQLQSRSQNDYLPNLQTAATSGKAALVVAVGFLMADAVAQASAQYPNVHFAIIDAVVPNRSNVLSITFRENEGSALVGALAALTAYYYNCTKVGIVLGMDIPVLWKFEIGYAYGVRWAQQYIKQKFGKDVNFKIYEIYTGSFNDPAKGKQAAQVMLSRGVCVIYQAAGATGLGVFQAVVEAAKAQGRSMGPPFAIGVDSDQDWIEPGFILASMMKRVDRAVYMAAQMAVNGTFRGGDLSLGLKEGGVGVSTLNDLQQFIQLGVEEGVITQSQAQNITKIVAQMRSSIPSWIWDAVDTLKQEILSGQVVVPLPATQQEVQKYRAELGLITAG
ncbi:MAG: BMP family protein [Thermoproteus sp.]